MQEGGTGGESALFATLSKVCRIVAALEGVSGGGSARDFRHPAEVAWTGCSGGIVLTEAVRGA